MEQLAFAFHVYLGANNSRFEISLEWACLKGHFCPSKRSPVHAGGPARSPDGGRRRGRVLSSVEQRLAPCVHHGDELESLNNIIGGGFLIA